MPFAVAKKAIDFAAQNAKKLNRPLDVGFIGPGEQTTVWELFTKVIRYIYAVADETGIQTNLTLATNGCYGEEKRAFIAGVHGIDSRQEMRAYVGRFAES